MSKFGIVLFNNEDEPGTISYDSRKQKVGVDLNPARKHVDVVEMNGGSILTGITPGGIFEETLLKIPHGLPFVPVVYGFFYVRDIPSDRLTQVKIGTFQKSHLGFIFNAFGYGYEFAEMTVDKDNVYVKHTVAGQSAEFRGNGRLVKFYFRYIVTNLPDLNSSNALKT